MHSKITEDQLDLKIKRYIPTEISTNIDHLSKNEKEAIDALVRAGRLIDLLFLKQVSPDNLELYQKLKNQAPLSEFNKKLLKYFWINRSPWCCLDEQEPFIEGVGERPKGANFYPLDATKHEIEQWIESLSDPEKAQAKGFFHIVRKQVVDGNTQFSLVPYSLEYQQELQEISQHLNTAYELLQSVNTSMARYLKSRAAALLSNDYYESDVAWLEIDDHSNLDVTIGPYEVYMDGLFNYKAAFECFIGIRDKPSTAELQKFSSNLQDVEDHLPISQKYRNPKIGTYSPIVTVNLLFSAGDVAGPQCAAFNLPNDEKVVSEKGSKRVMFKNVQQEKFKHIMIPIAQVALEEDQLQYLSFEAFFTHILCHELVHGLGPHNITVGNSATTVRACLGELHSAIEEAKADITGLFALKFFIDKGIIEKDKEKSFYVTFLVGAFRSIRFGLEEAHGKGQALQLNFLLEKGGFVYNPKNKKYSVNFEKIGAAVTELSSIIMTAQAEGNKESAHKLLDTYAKNLPETTLLLNSLTSIPTDISTSFPLAK